MKSGKPIEFSANRLSAGSRNKIGKRMAVATMEPASSAPLAEEHHAELAAANQRAKKIRRAVGVATFNGWVTGVFAAVSAPFAFFSASGFFVAVGLIAVAYNEFRGRNRLRDFDPRAAKTLGWNQLGFLAVITIYCVWMLVTCLTTTSPIMAEFESKPELRQALGSPEQLDQMYKAAIIAVYVSVIVLSALFQGLNAVYYFTRGKLVDEYLQQTPEWVLRVQRG